MTGVSNSPPGLYGKRLELLKEAFPAVARVGYLWNADSQSGVITWRLLQDQAPRLGIQLQSLAVRGPDDLANAFATATMGRADALIVNEDAWIFTHRAQPIGFAVQQRLPVIYARREWTADGGLMSYGSRFSESAHRLAVYVDRILRGAKPGDLPVEQPTVFDFVVNRTTLVNLGLTIPPDVAAQVTEWVQ